MNGDGLNVVLRNCRLGIADDAKALKSVVHQLVVLTKLKTLGKGDCQVGSPKLPGVSVTQIIETSHIAIHGFSENNSYIITIVSCMPFDVKKTLRYLKTEFEPRTMATSAFKVRL